MMEIFKYINLALSLRFSQALQTMSISLIAVILGACQQTPLSFTPTQAPTLADFDTQPNLPQVENIYLPNEQPFIDVTPDGRAIPYQLQRTTSTTKNLSNRVSLVAISPTIPFDNPDILQVAFQEKARGLALAQADACLETFETRVTLHSINISLTCPASANHLYQLLIQFWQHDAFSESVAIDIDNIRRQLKLNKHLNAFSGAEIDKVWRDKLLGTTHPYNKSINNDALFDSLSLNELSQLQQRTFAQANWQLFLPNHAQTEFDIKQSLSQWPTRIHTDSPSHIINTQKPPQSRTLYLIDAPGSVQTQVRIGYALDSNQLTQEDITLSCRSLAALLGRSFSGRLYYDLREKRGLTYGIYGQCANAPLSSSIKFYGSTAIEHTGAFVVGILDHLKLLASTPASEGELVALKTYLIGDALLTQDNPSLSETQFIHQQVLGLDLQSIKAINLKLQVLAPSQLMQLTQQAFYGEPLIILRGDVAKISADLAAKLPDWKLEVVKVNE